MSYVTLNRTAGRQKYCVSGRSVDGSDDKCPRFAQNPVRVGKGKASASGSRLFGANPVALATPPAGPSQLTVTTEDRAVGEYLWQPLGEIRRRSWPLVGFT
jgi:hypothetical protein